MAKRPTIDPALRELKQELLRTNDALKDAYTRFNCVCDSELIEASIYEISALKSRCNYLLRRIKALSGEAVPSAVPRASRCRPPLPPPYRRSRTYPASPPTP